MLLHELLPVFQLCNYKDNRNTKANTRKNAMNYEDGEPVGAVCPICYGTETEFDAGINSWKCDRCSTCWGKTKAMGYFSTPLYNENENQAKSEKKL